MRTKSRSLLKGMSARAVFHVLLSAVMMVLVCGQAVAEEIRVAVASNFADVIKTLSVRFEASTGHKVTLIFGSTGKHYAQIRNGAPFDAFFAADIKRPELLEKEGIALPGSRFTYARGKVILWSPGAGYIDAEGEVLAKGEFSYLAIANPGLAPYGKAAEEVLRARGLWDEMKTRIVRGENIGQAFQFVKSGNAELGFVASSQVKRPGPPVEGSWWVVPQALYTPVDQQAVLLKENEVARTFLSFVKSDESQALIREFGYATP
jgi:molybdate transport system substrate-binding protein